MIFMRNIHIKLAICQLFISCDVGEITILGLFPDSTTAIITVIYSETDINTSQFTGSD